MNTKNNMKEKMMQKRKKKKENQDEVSEGRKLYGKVAGIVMIMPYLHLYFIYG